VAPALIQGSGLLAQLIFTPLLAAWSIWVGIALSSRASDPRTAQQFSILASLPIVAITSLIAFEVIPATLRVAFLFGIALLVLIRVGWRVASALFDRERLITSTK
jgi:ABC-2 type transport system permease protein